MKKSLLILSIFSILMLALSACTISMITGSGKLTTETRSVSGFNSVLFAGLGDVTIDPPRREVTVAGRSVELRAKEFDLLHAFAEHKGLVLTRDQLLSRVWGYDFYGETRTVDVHVAHLRKQLAASASVRIVTVTGVGYKLVS